MDVDSNIVENLKKNYDSLRCNSVESTLLDVPIEKFDKNIQIRSSSRVYRKLKFEHEFDRKIEEKFSSDSNSPSSTGEVNTPTPPPVTSEHLTTGLIFPTTTTTNSEKHIENESKGTPLRSSSRVIKKPKQDVVNTVCDTKIKKDETVKNDSAKKVVRSNWSNEDKLMFFEAVNEYGKDFENIQLHINNKLKKKGATDEQLRTKEHVRQFYNRTFHDVYKHVKFSDSVKKNVQELYGIINYGELYKKLGSVSEKAFMKLTELVYSGSTVIRSKCKTIRVKTPMCRALIRINQLDEKYGNVKLPNRVTVELTPKDMTSYLKVQCMAQNPRLKTVLPLQKRLGALIQCLNKRWKTFDMLTYEKSIISSNAVTNNCVPSEDDVKEKIASLSPPLRLSPPQDAKIELPLINLSDYLTRQTICLSAYERRLGFDTFSNLSKKKKQKSETEQVPRVENPDIKMEQIKIEEVEVNKNEQSDANGCYDTEADNSVADAIDIALTTILSLQQKYDPTESDNTDTVEQKTEKIETEVNPEDLAKSNELNKHLQERIDQIKEGWTEQTSYSLTIGEIYLMFGFESILHLEYSWDTDLPPPREAKTVNDTITTNTNEGNFLEKWQEDYEEKIRIKKRNITESLSKLISLAQLQQEKNYFKCPCGHSCNVKNQTNGNNQKMKRNAGDNNTVDEPDEKKQLLTLNSQEGIPTMQEQLNSLHRLRPKLNNRRGRHRIKPVVVERQLPLLPNNLSGHQIVRMNIISQKPLDTVTEQVDIELDDGGQQEEVEEEDEQKEMKLETVLGDVEEDNAIIPSMPYPSPCSLIKDNGENEWSVGSYSLSSLLGHLEGHSKTNVLPTPSSSLGAEVSNEVNAQLHSLLTQSSMDFAVNFADLAASVTKEI